MTRHHLGSLEHWRQRSDIKQKEKYIDLEDTANPPGLLLMDRDAVLSFLKKGLYLDHSHARSVKLSEKVMEAGSHMIVWLAIFVSMRHLQGVFSPPLSGGTRSEGISRKSSSWVVCAPLPFRESSMHGPVQPASKPVSYRQTFDGTYPKNR